MRLAQIILDIPTQSLDSAYTYAVPDELVDAEVGCAVLVPFGNRQAIGYIVGLEEVDEADPSAFAALGLDPDRIRAVQRVLSRSYFDELGAACAQHMSEEYIAPLCSCVRLFTPPGGVPRMVHTGTYWRLEEPQIGPVDDRWVRLGPAAEGFEPKRTAVKQKAIVDALASGELRVTELSMELGSISSVLKTLSDKGVIEIESRRRLRGVDDGTARATRQGDRSTAFVPSAKPELTKGQAEALDVISAAQKRAAGDVVLVDGVTGSGKTEVYLRAIEETLGEGGGAIVLVPEISLTPQTVARFRGRFGDTVAVMHSRMSQGERYDQWDLIRSGVARVVVGARSALFTPMPALGLVIIDEEHEGSYKQDSSPRYMARDVAAWMVRERGATLVLGSATPAIETLYNCEKRDNWHRVVLAERANGKPMPEVEVVDMAREFGSGHRSMFSRKLTRALLETIEAGQKAVLLLNQRGFASFLLCRECGFVPECPSCSTSLTYHEKGSVLVCHHCGHKEPVPPVCPECGSPYLKKFGAGTQRVEAELVSVLEGTGAHVVRMDADTTSAKGAHQRLLEEFASSGAAVLLGTQMIAKGLDFDDVTLVGVINADTMLKLPDFRSAERTFALIEQVAGRAGRAELPGRVMVQTYWADSCAIQAAATYDRALFLKDELPKRKLLRYPPYVRMANVLVWGKDEREVEKAARELSVDIERTVSEQAGGSWTVLSANPCTLSRLRGTYRWHIVVKAPAGENVSGVLLPLFRKRKASKTVNVAIDVDPHDML